jgi:hypothetical protein
MNWNMLCELLQLSRKSEYQMVLQSHVQHVFLIKQKLFILKILHII